MPFNSFGFVLLFLPIATIGYAALQRWTGWRWAQIWLLLASLFFYGYGKPSFLPILLGSIGFNFLIARAILNTSGDRRRKWILRTGLAANVALLCSFKYVNFFLSALPHMTLPQWEFPLGISFFTLTQVMYLVDTYQGLNGPISPLDYATLISMFPYVTSGPLVSARDEVPQFRGNLSAHSRLDLACKGVFLFVLGLTKKVVLADSFARVADAGFDSAGVFSTVEAWIFSLAYTFQIYFDFSGYSDMAVGSAWMLGIDIPQNFNAPFRSKSISEFWRRWHISLSNFITNYLYTPLLRSMGKATLRTSAIAILLAMGITGLWHGPAWTFIVFGLLHGTGLAINQVWKKRKMKMPDWLGLALTFGFVNITFVFFRSRDIGFAFQMLAAMLPHASLTSLNLLNGVLPMSPAVFLRPVIVGVIAAFVFRTSTEMAKEFRHTNATACATAGLIVLALFYMNSPDTKQFVYFAF